VIATELCPKRLDIVWRSTPARSPKTAWEWRRAWSGRTGNPARLVARWKALAEWQADLDQSPTDGGAPAGRHGVREVPCAPQPDDAGAAMTQNPPTVATVLAEALASNLPTLCASLLWSIGQVASCPA
jgi:hypothetical protein